jgi:hypothetical protein
MSAATFSRRFAHESRSSLSSVTESGSAPYRQISPISCAGTIWRASSP